MGVSLSHPHSSVPYTPPPPTLIVAYLTPQEHTLQTPSPIAAGVSLTPPQQRGCLSHTPIAEYFTTAHERERQNKARKRGGKKQDRQGESLSLTLCILKPPITFSPGPLTKR